MLNSLFRDSWADGVQLVSFPLEVIGLLLAWIEVRRPRVAARITELLIEIGRTGRFFYTNRDIEPLALRLFTLFHLVVLVAFWLSLLVVDWHLPADPLPRLAVLIIALALPVTSASVLLRLTAGVLGVLSRFSGGRALGALGFLLACVGVLGEAYQVVSLAVQQYQPA
jgi:hypothetical protein